MIKKYSLYLTAIIFFLLFSNQVLADSSSITLSEANPSTITDVYQEYQVRVSLSINAPDETIYYLRGVFYKTDTTNYCGYTWNGSSWFSGPYFSNEGWKNFLPVTIASSSATILLKTKIDSRDSGCESSGTYNFKIQRFTQGGSARFDSQNEQTLTISIPTPTQTPSPSIKATNTVHPTSSQKTPTIKSDSKISIKISEVIVSTPIISKELESVNFTPTESLLGGNFSQDTNGKSQNILSSVEISDTKKDGSKAIVFTLLGIGVSFIIIAVIVSIKKLHGIKDQIS